MMRVLAFSMASVMIMFCGLPIANGETLSGSLTYKSSELDSAGLWVTGNKWSNAMIMSWWVVTDDEYPGFPWKYTYSFVLTSDNLQGGISHLIIECSEGMSEADIIVDVSGGAVLAEDPVELHKESGNPKMPENLWGIKFDPASSADERNMTWSFWSNRMPVWGDFYAKDGKDSTNEGGMDNTAYNKGFLSPDSDLDGQYHILRPDSLIPEPGSFVLLVTATVGLLGCAWRRKRRYW